jgi:proteasome lid subunit RPN8/RPN11
VDQIYKHLRQAGNEGFEGVALLAGILKENIFEIKTAIIPAQTAEKVESGLLYSVSGEELHEINVWLYKNDMTLIGQIHSHPTKAYHSSTDDRYPIVATYGAVSIVVPNFAFDPFTLDKWAVYRLNQNREWEEVLAKDVSLLIQIQY